MGFGGGLALFIVVGFLVLGPKSMQEALKHVARAKAELDRCSREIKSHLTAEIEGNVAACKESLQSTASSSTL